MIFAELKEEVRQLDLSKMRELGSMIRALLIAAGPTSSDGVREFVIGEMIEFTSKSGDVIRAKVKRLNDRTISCIAVGTGGKWRVSRSLVRQVTTKEVATSEIINPGILAAAKASIGARPTAARAGSW